MDKIITMSKSDLNKQAAMQMSTYSEVNSDISYYASVTFTGSEESLSLLDLDANNKLQTYYNPENLAEHFVKKGLSHSLTSIYIIASNVNKESSLFEFAHDFTCYLQKLWHKTIHVYVSADRTYALTIIQPPGYKENKEWLIYGLPHQARLNAASFNLASFDECIQSKPPIWSGSNIYEFLRHPSRKPYFNPDETQDDDIEQLFLLE